RGGRTLPARRGDPVRPLNTSNEETLTMIAHWLRNTTSDLDNPRTSRSRREKYHRPGALRAGCANRVSNRRRQLHLEPLEQRCLLAINVAVVGSTSGDNSGSAAIVSQLNDDTYSDFTATLVSPSQVDTVAEF